MSPAYQAAHPFAELQKAIADSEALAPPAPLAASFVERHAQGRTVNEVRFATLPGTLPYVARLTCRPGETGWWIDDIVWAPGAADRARAYLKAEEERKKEIEAKKNEVPNSPFGVTNGFVELLQKGDLAGAYGLTTDAFRSKTSREQF